MVPVDVNFGGFHSTQDRDRRQDWPHTCPGLAIWTREVSRKQPSYTVSISSDADILDHDPKGH